ncbi:nephrin isoform X1 [Brienomyrus brachyistius]|uniref:nephrin isoform X1 n=2 Tax=Brienomyrus brachyistius TaxID=42636 RepID=UPI0020B2C5EB|nr:nephrin isoform X1 [Brienomyrus brachyistius]XP_048880530.1 nephrin isoform X1 [Brienomyrus brachyistius]
MLLVCWSFFLSFIHLSAVCSQQVFRTQPKNITLKAGAAVVMKCAVLRPSGVVQWVKDGLLLGPQRSLPGFPRYSMTGNKDKGEYHLQIEKVALEDDSPYECQVGPSESSGPIISHTVWITVLIPPSKLFIEVNTEEPWIAGQEYIVTCTAEDAKPAADVTLFKDGVEMTGADSVTMSGSEEKLENTEAMVKFVAQSSDNGRQVVCRVKHPVLSHPLETSITMNVYFPPQPPVLEGLDTEMVPAGTSLKLVCISHGGNPLAMLHWTKNGEVISTSWEVDTLSRKASSILTLQVKPEDNHAELSCESVNQVSPQPFVLLRRLIVLFEPAEVKVLGSSKAIAGKTVTLSCYTTSSNPPVNIRWWLGFRELNQTVVTYTEGSNGGMVTMSNLTHTVSQEENGLPLTCEAFNRGTRYSKILSTPLQVFYPPQKVWIEGPPDGVPLHSGTTVRFMCFSTGGNPPGRLTWLKDGKAVRDTEKPVTTEKGVSRELILVLQPSDNMAIYRCDATNDATKVLSVETKLHVLFPAISVKIVAKQKEVSSGQELTLECITGSSNPKANISWNLGPQKLNGVDQAPTKAEYGGVSARSVLSLLLYSHQNGLRVTCEAFSVLLSEGVNTFYKLSVLYPPAFDPNQPILFQAKEDDAIHLPLIVSANPHDIDCVWTFLGKELLKGKDNNLRYHWREGLEIWNVTRKDAGQYNINCNNTEGQSNITLILDVQYAPSVRIVTDPVYVDLGQTANLMCKADANPLISGMFSWEWLGEEEEELGLQDEDEDTGWLTIAEVTRSHSGRYKCTVDNGIGPSASAEVQLVVRFKPEIQKGVQWSKVASRGDGSSNAEVICQAEGIPKVHLSWAKNNVPMDFADPRYEERTVREGWVYTSIVTIINVSTALDYAVFTCNARNALGEEQLAIQLLSTSHPDPPSELKLVSVTHSTVTLEWNKGFDGGLEQKFRVRYRWPGSASFLYVDVFPPWATIFTVSGLSPQTAYSFSVNALNSMGESGYADNDTVLTVITRELQPSYGQPDMDMETFASESLVMPLDWVITLTVLGGVLLVLNSLGCYVGLRKRRGKTLTDEKSNRSEGCMKTGEGSMLAELNRYDGGEMINTAAQRTLLVDSGSEPGSTVYETYGDDYSHKYYFPITNFQPSLYSHPERPEMHSARYSVGAESHNYEEVRDWRMYEDLGEVSLPPPHLLIPPFMTDHHRSWQETNLQEAYQRRRKDTADLETEDGAYDSVVEHNYDYELPFELRGELV